MGVLLLFVFVLLAMALLGALAVACIALSVAAIVYSRRDTVYQFVWAPALLIACYCGAEGLAAVADMSTNQFGQIAEMGGISMILIQLLWSIFILPTYPTIACLVWFFPRRDFDRRRSSGAIAATVAAMFAILLLVWLGSLQLTWPAIPVSNPPRRYITHGIACGVMAAIVGTAWFARLRTTSSYKFLWLPAIIAAIAAIWKTTTLIAHGERFEFLALIGPVSRSTYSWDLRSTALVNWSLAAASVGWLLGLIALWPRKGPPSTSSQPPRRTAIPLPYEMDSRR